jgi:hypothetical protein
MFVPAPIDKEFVPYTKRSVLRTNAGLFVDRATGRGRKARRVVQQQVDECSGRPDCYPCGYINGTPYYRCLDQKCGGSPADCPPIYFG